MSRTVGLTKKKKRVGQWDLCDWEVSIFYSYLIMTNKKETSFGHLDSCISMDKMGSVENSLDLSMHKLDLHASVHRQYLLNE